MLHTAEVRGRNPSAECRAEKGDLSCAVPKALWGGVAVDQGGIGVVIAIIRFDVGASCGAKHVSEATNRLFRSTFGIQKRHLGKSSFYVMTFLVVVINSVVYLLARQDCALIVGSPNGLDAD